MGQVFGKKRMVTVPSPFLVERCEQQLTFLGQPEQFVARACSGQKLTQRRAKSVEYRRAQHDLNYFARKTVKQFLEISADRPLRAGETAHILLEILSRLSRRGRHDPQRSRPAIRLVVQKLHVGWSERAGSLDLEKSLRFLQIKSQCRDVNFQQLVLRAQSRQRQRRLRSGSDYDVAMRGRASEEKCQCLMNIGIADPMVILQEQVYVVFYVSQIIDQSRYDGAWIDQEALLDQADRSRADPVARPL